jgi:RNA polymerase sigma factor (sigma-70 family)
LIGVCLAIGGPDEDSAWESRCLDEIRRGSRRAFSELYEAYARRLYSHVLLPRLGSAFAAEEALAETFRAALEHLGGYQPQRGGILRWLTTIAMNKATDIHRERARTGKALASFESLVAPLRDGPREEEALAERRLDQARLRAAVVEMLAEISPRYRRAIELRLLEDRSRGASARSGTPVRRRGTCPWRAPRRVHRDAPHPPRAGAGIARE